MAKHGKALTVNMATGGLSDQNGEDVRAADQDWRRYAPEWRRVHDMDVEAVYEPDSPHGTELRIKASVHDGWITTVTFGLIDGAIRVLRITNEPVVYKELFNVPVALLSPDLVEALEWEIGRPLTQFCLPGEWAEAAMMIRPKTGRRGNSQRFYAEWARRYLDACEKNPRSPYAVLANDWPGHAHGTLKQYIWRARDKGLLGPVPAGAKCGGELKAEAKVLLEIGADDGKR